MDVIENILGINLLNPKIYEFPFITNINSITMSNIYIIKVEVHIGIVWQYE